MADERDDAGRFLPGNRIWEARSSYGRKPTFIDDEALRAAVIEYFEWAEGSPLSEEKLFSYEGKVVRDKISKMQAMTIKGLCVFLDISYQNWTEYRARAAYSEVCEWAEAVIYQQKFTGAAAGLLNPAIIARDLGLADKSDHTSSDGTMSPQPAVVMNLSALSDEELDQLERLTDKARDPEGAGKA